MLINNNDVQSINAALIDLQNQLEKLQKQLTELKALVTNK